MSSGLITLSRINAYIPGDLATLYTIEAKNKVRALKQIKNINMYVLSQFKLLSQLFWLY